ncbi:hypothetical protein CKO15_03590 [Halorhodospira abdelmalekii]|uniref:TSUP family transporter n=1 Tax=Halorhodospira abdelmalekii TaxID=421629 RepID=UPI00190528A5|nr:hypothetical protein [Halorhodospira abdelmalekii]
MFELILYLLIGAAAGISAGLFGVGGGIIIVPMLLLIFTHQGVSGEVAMHLAVGTSLATVAVITAIAAYRHHRLGAVRGAALRRLLLPLLLGAGTGVALATLISGAMLERLFGLFLIAIAIHLALDRTPQEGGAQRHTRFDLPVGMSIGTVSALFGVGGGTLTVPYLAWQGLALRNAIATSSACAVPLAACGAIGFALIGQPVQEALPAGSSGFIYWPAFAAIVLGSLLTAGLAVRVCHRLSNRTLKLAFSLLLVTIGLYLVL